MHAEACKDIIIDNVYTVIKTRAETTNDTVLDYLRMEQ